MPSVISCCVLCVVCFVTIPVVHADCSNANSDDSFSLGERLLREGERAYTWRLTWTAINGGLTLLSMGGLVVLPRRQHPDLLLSAGVSAISTLFTWFWPMDVEVDAELAARLNELPEPERCAQLERLLEHSAADERERLTWPWHLGNFVTALIPAAVVWLGFHRPAEAALSLLGGFASGEIELLTQPNALLDIADARSSGVTLQVATRGLMIGYRAAW
jgi:hypothetical protein